MIIRVLLKLAFLAVVAVSAGSFISALAGRPMGPVALVEIGCADTFETTLNAAIEAAPTASEPICENPETGFVVDRVAGIITAFTVLGLMFLVVLTSLASGVRKTRHALE